MTTGTGPGALSPERRRLLELMLKQKGVAGVAGDRPVPLDPGERKLPSFGQRRLWFLDEMQPHDSVYNVPGAIELRGPLDHGALQRALNAIAERHEALRTTFAADGSEPVQVVSPEAHVDLPEIDVSDLPADRRYDRAIEVATEVSSRPFDLAAGPLWRTALIHLEEERHVFVTCMHHIVSDGWSLGILAAELSELYSAYVEGRAPELAPLEISYADFAVWQRRWFQGPELERQLAYWKDQLAGAPAVLELPSDRPRPRIQSFEGATASFTFPPELSGAIERLARAREVTTFMVTLAAFQTLLHRYTGATDIVVGSPIAGRNRSEIEGLIGFFVNTLVLRTDLSGDPSFTELLERIREVALGAYAHQDLPFEKLVEELKPPRDLSISPVFQVSFSMQDASAGDFHLSGLEVGFPDVKDDSAKVDLSLFMFEGEDGIGGEFNYATALFDKTTIETVIAHFHTLLEGIVADPDAPISRHPLIGAEEQRRIVEELNPSPAPASPAPFVHEQLAARARAHPGDVALVAGDATLTFGELDRRARAVAASIDAGPGDIVAVLMERSLDQVVAQLGILKTGAAYLPLDPAYPPKRLSLMLDDARPKAVISSLEDLPPPQQSSRDAAVTGEDLAYVIYTSGSTGTPKGVAVTHGNLANLLGWDGSVYLGRGRASSLAPLSADASVWELWPPLAAGTPVVLVDKEVARDPEALVRAFDRHAVATGFVPTATAHVLLRSKAPPGLRTLMTAGERLTAAPEETFTAEVVNLYGPTETTVAATAGFVAPGSGVPDIGTPVRGVRVYLLDEHLRPVPRGLQGEIYIGGRGVARGYLNAPALTAEAFLPDPFYPELGARMYRSGDRARYRPDGTIDFLGRRDEQVKVRGYRVEPAEVEAALRTHPAVSECAVGTVVDSSGATSLVAYLVSSHAPTVSELRDYLAELLPAHMLPASFVTLAELPLTPAGKVDRSALPAPGPGRPDLGHGYAEPATETEKMLAEIWEEVLAVERVGRDDNFFDLGGHSLLGTQLMSRIRNRFEIEVPLRALFERPTVGGLAAALDAYERRDVLPLERGKRAEDALLSFAQQRMWFIDQIDPASATYNVPIALRLTGRVDASLLERALNAIVDRHETLRTTFTTVRGEPRQVVAPAGRVTLSRVDLSYLEAGEREEAAFKVANEEAERPFDLATGPLWRTTLIELGDEDHLFVVCMHHIVSDGWSLGIFAAELSEIYAALVEGREPDLEPLPIQYADFAEWQREWFQGAELDRQLSYWKSHLAGAPAALEIPTDYPRPPIQSFAGNSVTFQMPADLSEAVNDLARAHGVTTFMLAMAAFSTFLHRYTGSTDIVLGTPIAGRNRSEIEGLIGFFVNTLVMRNDLSGDPRFTELIERARDVALAAYAHQDLPFEKLVEELKPPRDLSHSPLFQVAFGFQNTPTPEFDLTGLGIDLPDLEDTSAKFDLSMDMVETDEGLAGSLNYATALFERRTIEEMIVHLTVLLQSIVDDPDAHLSELRILTDEEKDLVVHGFNRTAAEYPAVTLMHEFFEAHARERPDALALSFEGKTITYGELNAQANRLAHHLRGRGLGPERFVGILLERGIDLIVAVVGVLKSGAAYVPVDPAYPPGRIEFTFRDAGVDVVVTASEVEELVPEDVARVRVDVDAEAIAASPASDPDRVSRPGDVAYVIYTSGSTGTPKGVLVEHHGFANLVAVVGRDFDVAPADRVLLFSSIGFDGSLFDVAVALAGGATLCLGTRASLLPGPDLFRTMSDERVTIASLQPSALAALRSNDLPELRVLMIAGEVCPGDLAQQWARQRRVFNGYGPTEATIGCTWYEIPYAPAATLQSPPIGRPIANTAIYVLDRDLEPVPVGVPGEMYVAGAGLARGYLKRPDVTAERFLPNPFAHEPGARMYRTGDVGRFRRDGSIEFLGRADRQVKVRGFRIELGEIETALAAHPSVREAVVDARGEAPGDKRLVAYYVPADPPPTVTQLRAHLATTLPDYMIPAAFVALPDLPLLPNGKIDRAALPAPEAARPELGTEFEPPRTDTERKLVEIWKRVLRLDKVGIFDNFFELGGDSILIIQVVARAAEEGIHLTAKQMFQAQTIYDLSLLDDQTSSFTPEQGMVTGPVPLTPIQRWFFEQDPPEPHHFNQAMVVEVEPELTEDLVREAVALVLTQHDALRARFTKDGDEWRQYVGGLTEDVPFERIDLRGLAGADEATAFLAHAERVQRSFDLSRGPLLRVAMFDRSPPYVPGLLLVAHHLVVDAVSWPILIEDVHDVCRKLQRRDEAKLPPKSTSFKWWAQKMDEYTRSPLLARELDYWLSALPPRVEPLPVDHTDGANDVGSAATVNLRMDGGTTSGLLHEVPSRLGTQIMDVLIEALTLAVQEWKGSQGLLADLEGHGRQEVFEGANLFATVGWFTTLYPFYSSLAPEDGVESNLSKTKAALAAIPNKGFGYGPLRYMTEEGKRLADLPAAELSFNYFGRMDSAYGEGTFSPTFGATGPVTSPLMKRAHLLQVSASVVGDGLHMQWTYSENRHERASIERLARLFEDRVRAVVAAARGAVVTDRWTVVPRPNADPRLRLFCFPYAGGSAATYRTWSDVLPPDIEVQSIQLPGREWRSKEEPYTSVFPLVEDLAVVLKGFFDSPFAFFGHSLGALISFELARELRRRGLPPPDHVFLSGHRAPQLPKTEPEIHDAPDEEFYTGLRNLEETPKELLANEELMELLLPALRADFAIAETYEHSTEPPLDCPLSVFGGLGDLVTDKPKLEPWAEHTTRELKLRMVPGGHFFVNESRDLILRAVFQDLLPVQRRHA
jgi:amino acid adenylation domain-containing protein/non-ribosomal peptide synthase protein (TIGR01720 family)